MFFAGRSRRESIIINIVKMKLAGHPRLTRYLWFAAIYCASVLVFGIISGVLEAVMPR